MELTLVGSKTPYPFMDKVLRINRSTNRSQRQTNQHFFSIQNHWKQWDFECPIHGIINSGKIEGAYFGRVRSMFWAKQLHNDFFWRDVLVIWKMNKHLFYCRFFQIFYYLIFPEKLTSSLLIGYNFGPLYFAHDWAIPMPIFYIKIIFILVIFPEIWIHCHYLLTDHRKCFVFWIL